MMKGGICRYAAGSQLKAAVKFLRAHKGQVALVTIDIGANDVDNCVTSSGFNLKCLAKGEASIKKNVPKIAGALRAAAGPKVPIFGMTYYDPFLADWFNGTNGQQEAEASQGLAKAVNGEITKAYKSKQVRVAFVAAAFHTYKPFTDTTNLHWRKVPVAVAEICKLTWMCAPAPRGPNIHANAAGYAEIAAVFENKKGL
jgi:lysophospholipase L1-like esterase